MREAQIVHTAASIAAAQRGDGCIPWYEGGPADPWDHVEAAMSLGVAGLHTEARRAYRWLANTQHPDGSWASLYRGEGVTDPTRDANLAAYVAAGVWHHHLCASDERFVSSMWDTVERAVDFALGLQAPGGEIWWARDARGTAWPGALLTSSSCIHLSLRCAIAAAEFLGHERPDWELSLGSLASAVAFRPGAFEPKDRYSMDWYYPVLGGVLTGDTARARLRESWDQFVVEGWGVRCVSDRPWVTVAETCELVIALDCAGMHDEAREVFSWVSRLRFEDGSYWTGCTFPDGAVWPEERPTWTSGAVLLAADVLDGVTPASSIFRGTQLPRGLGFGGPSGGGAPRLSDAVADPAQHA